MLPKIAKLPLSLSKNRKNEKKWAEKAQEFERTKRRLKAATIEAGADEVRYEAETDTLENPDSRRSPFRALPTHKIFDDLVCLVEWLANCLELSGHVELRKNAGELRKWCENPDALLAVSWFEAVGSA